MRSTRLHPHLLRRTIHSFIFPSPPSSHPVQQESSILLLPNNQSSSPMCAWREGLGSIAVAVGCLMLARCVLLGAL
ncbi:hypothetical protein SORBI_3005G165850 [Sorghum bicolor]|uniref:Uncharacterized protein n=1 Tax=Sorghum bicolor TaxID=4558 RepID=A0A1Z5RIZ8_SORBI|nr:hypothetical protein SORBI_3005G165850 [Sorghum bicolor]OQU83733.1 hypothetical protein SORBI_3005G165850 [Sorghum bicolor]